MHFDCRLIRRTVLVDENCRTTLSLYTKLLFHVEYTKAKLYPTYTLTTGLLKYSGIVYALCIYVKPKDEYNNEPKDLL